MPGHFLGISLSRIFGLLLLSFLGAIVFFILAELVGWGLSESDLIHLTGIVLFLPVLGYLLVKTRSDRGLRRPLLGRPGETPPWRMAWIFLPLLVLSIGLGWLWDLFLYQVMPNYLEGKYAMINETPFMDPNTSVLNTAITFLGAVIVAPLVEEILFRGVILERGSRHWGLGAAVLISSFLFGMLHFDPLGSTLFGVLMCLVYLQSSSLLVPILVHALNNLAVMGMTVFWPASLSFFDTPEQLYSQAWFGVASLAAGGAWAGWFLWQRRGQLAWLAGEGWKAGREEHADEDDRNNAKEGGETDEHEADLLDAHSSNGTGATRG